MFFIFIGIAIVLMTFYTGMGLRGVGGLPSSSLSSIVFGRLRIRTRSFGIGGNSKYSHISCGGSIVATSGGLGS